MRADRAALRELVGDALNHLPANWFSRLRDAHARSTAEGHGGARQRLLSAAAGVARYRALPVDEFTIADYPDVRLSAADSYVTAIVYWFGGDAYEGAETRWWRRACSEAKHVLELGANVGYYTVQGAVANPACRYVAVEPHPTNAATVRRNLQLNGIENVEVVEAAAVGTSGLGPLELSVPDQDRYGAPAGAFVRAGGDGVEDIKVGQEVTVDTVGIRDLIDGVDLIKLDIEGHEVDVLEPVLDYLQDRKPTLFLEVRMAATSRLRDLVVELAGAGYAVLAIGTDSLHLVTHEELIGSRPLPRYGSRDLLLIDEAAVGSL